jgi:hypothetical protein
MLIALPLDKQKFLKIISLFYYNRSCFKHHSVYFIYSTKGQSTLQQAMMSLQCQSCTRLRNAFCTKCRNFLGRTNEKVYNFNKILQHGPIA